MIELFVSNREVTEQLRIKLSWLGRTEFYEGLYELLWCGLARPSRTFLLLSTILSCGVGAILVMALILAYSGIPWLSFAVSSIAILYLVNLFTHYRNRRKLEAKILAIRYLSRTVTIANRLSKAVLPGLAEWQRDLSRLARIAQFVSVWPLR